MGYIYEPVDGKRVKQARFYIYRYGVLYYIRNRRARGTNVACVTLASAARACAASETGGLGPWSVTARHFLKRNLEMCLCRGILYVHYAWQVA